MDELAAAAAVLAVAIDPESDDDMVLETSGGAVGVETRAHREVESSCMDKENLNNFPVDRQPRAEVPKVISSPHASSPLHARSPYPVLCPHPYHRRQQLHCL